MIYSEFEPELKRVAQNALSKMGDVVDEHAYPRSYRVFCVDLIDPNLIGRYIAKRLSRKTYDDEEYEALNIRDLENANTSISFVEAQKLINAINNNPILINTFGFISDSIEVYFADLLSANEANDFIRRNAERFNEEAANLTLISELLPQMMMGHLYGQVLGNLTAEDYDQGLFHAFSRRAFGSKCPMGKRIASIFALKLQRISDDEVIILPERTSGALPAFLYNEIAAATSSPHHHPASAPRPLTSPGFHRG